MKKLKLSHILVFSLLAGSLSACASGQTPTLSKPASGSANAPSPQPAGQPSAQPTSSLPPSPEPSAQASATPLPEPSQEAAPEPQPTAEPELLTNLTGVWKGGSNGRYYLRQSGDKLLWYGESSANSPDWAQVAIGTRSADRIEMEWYDVPKGGSSHHGTLKARLQPDQSLTEQSHTGPLNERDWKLQTQAPSYPLVDQDGPLLAEEPAYDYSGVWKDLSGARFYLSQQGTKIVGYAESSPSNPSWSAIIYGKISGNTLRLSWAGLPKSTQANFSFSSGVQRMKSPNANILQLQEGSQTPVIGMSKWARVQ